MQRRHHCGKAFILIHRYRGKDISNVAAFSGLVRRYRNIGCETVRLPIVEAMIEGRAPTAEVIAAAADAAAEASDPPADIHATSDYRRQIVRVLTQRVLARSFERAMAS